MTKQKYLEIINDINDTIRWNRKEKLMPVQTIILVSAPFSLLSSASPHSLPTLSLSPVCLSYKHYMTLISVCVCVCVLVCWCVFRTVYENNFYFITGMKFLSVVA